VKGNVDVPEALWPMDGVTWLKALAAALKGHMLEAKLKEAMLVLFRRATAEDMEVLASVAAYHPGIIPDEQILISLESIRGLSDGCKSTLSGALCCALLDRGLVYDVRLRSFASQPSIRQWLAPAYVCFDHSWTLASLGSWFSGDNDTDKSVLRTLLMRLTLGELIAFEEEIKDLPLQATTRKLCSDEFARLSALQMFIERGLSVRWNQKC
jgi:hypothetical protein